MGAWIEMSSSTGFFFAGFVAPLVGAWIEIAVRADPEYVSRKSLPSWERGLKSAGSILLL